MLDKRFLKGSLLSVESDMIKVIKWFGGRNAR